MHVVVSRDEAPAAVAHSKVPTDQWLTVGALAGGEASASHLPLEQEECKITIFKEPQKIGTRETSFAIYMSLRASGLARLVSYGQHNSDTTCHTPF
jgi:hypothetical protein